MENEDQARTVELPPHKKLVVLTQTTLGVDDTAEVVAALRGRFPYLELPPTDDVCYATQNRQDAVKAMADRGLDLLLVVGSRNSSNAARLVEVAQARGVRGFLIDRPEEIQAHWLDGVGTVGVTAGASTPEPVIQAVLDKLRQCGGQSVESVSTADEDVVFQLPVVLREAMDSKASP